MCLACFSAVNIELIFGSDADSGIFSVVAVAPTHFSLLKLSGYMFSSSVFVLDKFFKSLLLSQS